MSGVQNIAVTDDEAGMRIDRWFKSHFPTVTHGQLEKFLRKGEVRVGGGRVKSNRRLEAGENIRIPPLSTVPTQRKAQASGDKESRKLIAAMTLYEDDDILALNKPFGLAVQGGEKTARHVDGMMASLEKDGVRPKLVHRLDKDTGGLLLVAKTRKAAQSLAEAFKGRDVEKTYWALVVGAPRPKQGEINMPVAKRMVRIGGKGVEQVVPAEGEGAKPAVSLYQIVEDIGRVAFVAMRPITGRTHQLRVHAAAIGHPIVGDYKYGGAESRIEGVAEKLHLFCRAMTFNHPRTGKTMTINAPLTGVMKETWSFFGFDDNAEVEWPELDQ